MKLISFSPKSLVYRLKHLCEGLDRINQYIAPPAGTSFATPGDMSRGAILFGTWTFIAVFVVFGLWSVIAPLKSAAVSSGQVVLDANRKTIQHLEGGIVDEILVHEGKIVKKGEGLIRLNETAAQARLNMVRGQYWLMRATEARLIAERDEKSDIAFPQELLDKTKEVPQINEILDNQKRLFVSRQDTLKGKVSILTQKIAQSKQEIQGLSAQEASAGNQIKLLKEETDVVRALLEKGNAVKPRLLALQRTAEELQGRRGENLALISRSQQAITEAEYAIKNERTNFLNQVNQELRDAQAQVADLKEKLDTSADISKRLLIVAPVDGIVTGLAVHTSGGVIAPGEKLMDIVPTNDKLIIESQISPQDIDVVHAGLEAQIHLTAYKTRKTPNLKGKVVNISADRFNDNRTGASYYIARIEADAEEFKAIEDVKLSPGMPADVLIITGERTLFSYMMAPITDSFNKALREQ